VIEHSLQEFFGIDTKFKDWGSSKRNNKQFMKYINEISSEDVYDPEILEIFSETEHEKSDT